MMAGFLPSDWANLRLQFDLSWNTVRCRKIKKGGIYMKMDSLEAGRRNGRGRSASTRQSKNAKTKSRSAAHSSKRGSQKASGRSSGSASTRRRTRSASAAKSTTDLNEIRRWAEERDGKPVTVVGTASRGEAGLLRIDFPGYSGAGRLEEISWDDWYEKFNESKLQFLYQDKPESRFFKLVSRGNSRKGGSSKPSRSKKRQTSG